MIVYLMAILKSIGDQKKIVRKFGVSKLMNVSKKLNRLKLSELIRLLKCDEGSTR